MKRVFAVGLMCAALAQAGLRRRWWVSVAAVAGAATADVLSSRGKLELNPLARGADGRFNTRRAVVLKCVVAGGVMGAQWVLTRKDERPPRAFEYLNYGMAGAWMGAAVHNWRIPVSR